MNKNSWEKLPPDVQKAFDANNRRGLAGARSARSGPIRKKAASAWRRSAATSTSSLTRSRTRDVQRRSSSPWSQRWIDEVKAKGIDGNALVDEGARADREVLQVARWPTQPAKAADGPGGSRRAALIEGWALARRRRAARHRPHDRLEHRDRLHFRQAAAGRFRADPDPASRWPSSSFLPYCQLTGANVTVDMFTAGAGPRTVAALGVLSALLALAVSAGAHLAHLGRPARLPAVRRNHGRS